MVRSCHDRIMMIRTEHDFFWNKLQPALMTLFHTKDTLPCKLTVQCIQIAEEKSHCLRASPSRKVEVLKMYVPAGFCLPEEQQRVWDKYRGEAGPSMQSDASATSASSVEDVSHNATRQGTINSSQIHVRYLFLMEIQILKQPLTRSVLREVQDALTCKMQQQRACLA